MGKQHVQVPLLPELRVLHVTSLLWRLPLCVVSGKLQDVAYKRLTLTDYGSFVLTDLQVCPCCCHLGEMTNHSKQRACCSNSHSHPVQPMRMLPAPVQPVSARNRAARSTYSTSSSSTLKVHVLTVVNKLLLAAC